MIPVFAPVLAAASLEPASVALKFGFLAVLYLFLLWVARSVVRDLRRRPDEDVVEEHWDEREGYDATGIYAASQGMDPGGRGDGRPPRDPQLVVERAEGHPTGVAYRLDGPVTFGRGANVEIRLEDPFASSRHARIAPQGEVLVIEDLGSTNGTYLNEEQLRGPQPLHPGDRIRIGSSEFSYQD